MTRLIGLWPLLWLNSAAATTFCHLEELPDHPTEDPPALAANVGEEVNPYAEGSPPPDVAKITKLELGATPTKSGVKRDTLYNNVQRDELIYVPKANGFLADYCDNKAMGLLPANHFDAVHGHALQFDPIGLPAAHDPEIAPDLSKPEVVQAIMFRRMAKNVIRILKPGKAFLVSTRAPIGKNPLEEITRILKEEGFVEVKFIRIERPEGALSFSAKKPETSPPN